jgi:hypothetical protein
VLSAQHRSRNRRLFGSGAIVDTTANNNRPRDLNVRAKPRLRVVSNSTAAAAYGHQLEIVSFPNLSWLAAPVLPEPE